MPPLEKELDEGMRALVLLIEEAVAQEVDDVAATVSERVQETLNGTLHLSKEISDAIGVPPEDILGPLVQILSDPTATGAKTLLLKIKKTVVALKERIADLEMLKKPADQSVSDPDIAPGVDNSEAAASLATNARLESEITQLRAELESLKGELAQSQAALKEAAAKLSTAARANSDIILIRERLLKHLQEVAQEIESAVVMARNNATEPEGEALVALISFQEIEALASQCQAIFQGLASERLGNLRLFGKALEAYEALLRAIGAAEKIPSSTLFSQAVSCLATFQALLTIQEQMIAEDVGETINVPREWIGVNGVLIDFYELLEVPYGSDTVEIKKAYHRKSRRAHPDRNGGTDNQGFEQLAFAWEILEDTEKRTLYDKAYAVAYPEKLHQ
ncbi:MAG: DnaJ [Candidatus Peregrinibacteria bacterium GW2011_GWF2_39_17]|nr:MAG: DnaJ [Candidatus Peregrinibacteria bacterium GW2011_GWF2_39_17]HCW32105.1 hypothetical protein [Candidatus Peregrinibacteria bacterium]